MSSLPITAAQLQKEPRVSVPTHYKSNKSSEVVRYSFYVDGILLKKKPLLQVDACNYFSKYDKSILNNHSWKSPACVTSNLVKVYVRVSRQK